MKRRHLLPSLAGAIAWPTIARARAMRLGDIAIAQAWALPVRVSRDGQAFVTLTNTGTAPDELVAARSSVCGPIELRRNSRYDDPPLASFVLAPREALEMKPAARHLRLMGLVGSLRAGQRLAIILDFLNAGEVEVVFDVRDGA